MIVLGGGVEGRTVSNPRETVPTNFAAVIGQTRIMVGACISLSLSVWWC